MKAGVVAEVSATMVEIPHSRYTGEMVGMVEGGIAQARRGGAVAVAVAVAAAAADAIAAAEAFV